MAGDRRRSVLAGLALGVAALAAIDEVVFHQLLAWHHFYDRSTSDVGLLSDGLLQSVYLLLLVGGFFLFADLRRDGTVAVGPMRGALLVGAGGFQLFDGLVNHKVLGLHQVRDDVELLPYDLAWNLGGLVLLAIGVVVLRRSWSEADRAGADRTRP